MMHVPVAYTDLSNTNALAHKSALRRTRDAGIQTPLAATVPHAHLLGRGNVLLVEDDPEVLAFATAAVQSFGYNVYPAQTAEEALSFFDRDLPIDVLFADIRLPGSMNGIALAHAAKKIDSGVEVLMTSGYPQGTYLKLLGFQDDMDFIPKPYPVSVLREKLDMLNNHHKRFS